MKKILGLLLVTAMMSTMAYAGWFGRSKSENKMIQLKGSDTILNLGQAVAEDFMKINKKAKIAVTGGGSGTGIAALLNKTVDIAQASRPIKSKEVKKGKEMGIEVKEWTVAFDGITVIINKNNPVSDLSVDQLRSIFIGEISNWKEVGGEDKKIVALSRDSSSGTHAFYKEHVLRKGNEKGPEEYRSDAIFLPSNQAIVDEIVKNETAIGYIGMGYMTPKVKDVAVNGIKASVANVANKTYPVARGLYWYTDGEPTGNTKKLIDFMFSSEGQKLVSKEGFVPVK